MKNAALFVSALLIAIAAGAQTAPDSSQRLAQNPPPTATVVTDNSLYSVYIADPELLKSLTIETLRPEHVFPVLGNYSSATNASTNNITVTLDSINKGIVWVHGLPGGTFKALMKKAPATYKIPAQKTESGKNVAEGSLFYNPPSKEITVVLGRPFDDADPTSFTTATGGQKGWQYTGTKGSVAVPPTSRQ